MNAQQAPSWCCRHNAPSGAAQTACVVAHRIIDGSSHSANPTRATVVRPDPVDEKRFALAHINAPVESVGGGSSGSDASRTKTRASTTQRSRNA